MSIWIEVDGRSIHLKGPCNLHDIENSIFNDGGNTNNIYFMYNGKKLTENIVVENGIVRASFRVLGGKGGFGSMLRAIGAQIEKTTNREACRDLSGRRLRDINEEKRLKNWIAQQAEREREAAERRKKKLERLCFQPKHDFTDQDYEKARTELTEKVHDAVEQGFRSASTSTNELKRKPESKVNEQSKKRKTCLWVDDIEDENLSSDDSDSDTEQTRKMGEKESNVNTCSVDLQANDENVKSQASISIVKSEDSPNTNSTDAEATCQEASVAVDSNNEEYDENDSEVNRSSSVNVTK